MVTTSKLPVTHFGKYQLVKHLATGGMAEIFLACISGPAGFRKPVAIKRVRADQAEKKDIANSLLREAKVVATMSHPAIVPVLDFGEQDGHYYIAMEYVHGYSLHRVVRKAAKSGVAIGARMATEIGIRVASALDYAHNHRGQDNKAMGIVHRDVTPGNIIVSFTGHVKLTDFGIVKLNEAENQTRTGVIKGKFAYMAPEQVSGATLDGRSDIFSLGVVLFEVATGHRLFKRDEPAAELMAVISGEIPSMRELVPTISPVFEKIVMRCLKRDPKQRYATAADLQTALEEFAHSEKWGHREQSIGKMMQHLFPGKLEENILENVDFSAEAQQLPPASMVSQIYTPSGSQTGQLPIVPIHPTNNRTIIYGVAGLTIATLFVWLWIFFFYL